MYRDVHANALFLRGEYEACAQYVYEGAREEADARAAFHYGYFLMHGIGVARDPEEARHFFSYARGLEGGESCYNLAMLHMHGEGGPRDYRAAIAYMREAAELDCLEAQLYLGMVYTTGCVLEPEIVAVTLIPFHKPIYRDISAGLLEGALSADEAEADEAARCSVVEADAREAFAYFRQAAHHDPTYVAELVAKGQYLYAKCYLDGMGTDFNRDKAARLMLVAGKSGSQEAIAFLSENGIRPQELLGDGRGRR